MVEMIEIKNGALTATINPKGAELTHVVDEAGFDYIWNGAEWPKHAPILFPAIGRSVADSYLIDGKAYPMQQHGFASDFIFDVAEQTATAVTLILTDNDATRRSYPFHFELRVCFALTGQALAVTFTMANRDATDLSFALGFHPALNLPGQFDDYQVALTPTPSDLTQFEIVKMPYPFRSGKLVKFDGIDNGVILLSHGIFDQGLVIFDHGFTQAKLSSKTSDYAVTLDMTGFSRLCLWTKEDAPLPYLCVEPFQGLPDIAGQPQELLTKEGNQRLAANESADFATTLTFGGD